MRKLWVNISMVALAALAVPFSLRAQLYPVKRYTEAEGLAHSNVFRIMQDSKGLIWFSTNDGISRFDGKDFTNFTTANGLPNHSVLSITELQNGDKLVSTFGGICIFHNDSVLPVKATKGVMPQKVLYAAQDNERTWIIPRYGVYKDICFIKGGIVTTTQVRNAAGTALEVYKMIYQPGLGMIFLTSEGMYTWKDGAFYPYLENITKEKIYDLTIDSTNCYWIAIRQKVFYTDGTRIIKSFDLPANPGVADMQLDSQGNLWIVFPASRVLLISGDNLIDITNRVGTGNIIINDIFEDNEKNIWLATNGSGVYCFSFTGMLNFYPGNNLLSSYATALCSYKNSVLVGSYGSVCRIEKEKIAPLPVSSMRPDDYIYFLAIENDVLHIGVPHSLITKNLVTGKETMEAPGVIAYCKAANGKVWMGSYDALGHLENGRFVKEDIPLLKNVRVNCLLENKDKDLLIGTDSGLFILRNNNCARLQTPAVNSSDYIYAIAENRNGDLFIATTNGLAYCINRHWGKLTEKDGLSHKKCNAVVEGYGNYIWIGTQKGLNRLDYSTMKITEHPTGLSPNEIISLFIGADNYLTAGTTSGVCRMLQLSDEVTLKPPPLYITNVTTSAGNLKSPASVSLEYHNAKIKIDYIGLSYRYSGNIEYRYTMKNTGDAWTITKNNSVEFPSLNSGEYTFVVQARLNGGNWSSPAELRISVPLPFYRTGWFMILSALLIAALLMWLVKSRTQRKEKQKREKLNIEQKMNYLEQQALAALINPHFIFNCLNSIQFYINRNDKEEANKYLTMFGRLMRLTLDNAQKTFIVLADEIDRLSFYLELEKLRCREILNYKLEVDPSIDPATLLVPNMIIQPYIENAIWHGIMPKPVPGYLLVSFSKTENGELQILIDDDGTGINQRMLHKAVDKSSYGMKLSAERLSLLAQTDNLQHSVTAIDKSTLTPPSAGTLIKLLLPVVPVALSSANDVVASG